MSAFSPYDYLRSSNGQRNSQNVFSDDDDFWNHYNSLNPQYRAQLDPYLHYTYTPGWKDRIRNFFGMRSNEDSVREAAAAQAWQMLGSLENDVFQNDYNSAEEQAAREKDAGINPDLTGELQSEGAAQQEQPFTPPYIDFLTPPSSFGQDLMNVFGQASQLVSSVASFESMVTGRAVGIGQLGLIGEQTTGAQITNTSTARDEVLKVLKGLNPEAWAKYTFDDSGMDEKLQEDFFNTYFSKYPESTHKYLKAAIGSITSDPALMRDYYEASKGASQGFAESAAYGDVYGHPSLGYDMLRICNDEILSFIKSGLIEKEKYFKLTGELNNIEAENSIALAEFARKNKLPEQLGKTELMQAITTRVQLAQDQRRLQAERDWLATMQKLRRSDDPNKRAEANYLIQAYFAKGVPHRGNTSWSWDNQVGNVLLNMKRGQSGQSTWTFDPGLPE